YLELMFVAHIFQAKRDQMILVRRKLKVENIYQFSQARVVTFDFKPAHFFASVSVPNTDRAVIHTTGNNPLAVIRKAACANVGFVPFQKMERFSSHSIQKLHCVPAPCGRCYSFSPRRNSLCDSVVIMAGPIVQLLPCAYFPQADFSLSRR